MRFIARHFHNGDMICTMHLCLSYWGSHFILLQREHEMGRGWKWEKEILQNWMRHRGFWPCGIEKYSIFLPFIVGGRGYHFLLPQREEGRGNRWIWGKREEVAEDWDLTTASNMMCPFASAGCAFAPPSSWIFHTWLNHLRHRRERTEKRTLKQRAIHFSSLSQPLWPWETRKKFRPLPFQSIFHGHRSHGCEFTQS